MASKINKKQPISNKSVYSTNINSKIKNNNSKQKSLRQIIFKFKTQKCSPNKTPPKSLNRKKNGNMENKNTHVVNNLINNSSKNKIIPQEYKSIISSNNEIKNITNSFNYNNSNLNNINININKTLGNNYNQKNTYIKCIKNNPQNNYSNIYKINNDILNNTVQVLNKNAPNDCITKQTFLNNNILNEIKNNKKIKRKTSNNSKNKINVQIKFDQSNNINFRNSNTTNYNTNSIHSNTNNTNYANITNSSINNVINYSCSGPNNIHFIYPHQKKKIILQPNKSFKQQRTVFFKNCNKELNEYIGNKNNNITMTTPVTVNNSRKNSSEKKNRSKNSLLTHFQTKKNLILTNPAYIHNFNHNTNKRISNNFLQPSQQNLSTNYSNERISTIKECDPKIKISNYIKKMKKNSNKNLFHIAKKNNNMNLNKFQFENFMNNMNKVNYTASNIKSKYSTSSLKPKINDRKKKEKIYYRPGNININYNILNFKVPHLTALKSNELNNCYSSSSKIRDNNLNLTSINKNNVIISKTLINNNSFNFFSLKLNKDMSKRSVVSNTVSHKQSLSNLIKDNKINKNQINNANINLSKNNYLNKSNNKKINKQNNSTSNTANYNKLINNLSNSNNTTTSNKNHKITPKIVDIKKCLVTNNTNNLPKGISTSKKNSKLAYNTINAQLILKNIEYKMANENSPQNLIKKNNKSIFNSNSNSNSVVIKKIAFRSENRTVGNSQEKLKLIRKIQRNKLESKSNAVSKSESKSKSKILKPKIKSGLYREEDIKKCQKNNKNISNNGSANKSQKSFKNILCKKEKYKLEYNSSENTIKKNNENKNNNRINNNYPDFESSINNIKIKDNKKSLIKLGVYYLTESENLSKYIIDYYNSKKTYPNTQISFYKYGRLIGKGAFGKVNIGLHVLTGRIVAIKSFNKKKLKNEHAKLKILQEIELMKNLRHSSVVKLLDTFETNEYLLIIMENISGGDLLSFVKKRTKLNEKICKHIFKQLLLSIKFIHSKNIIHRDIKLDNILIDLNNNIKLCDFGVGKMIHENEIIKEQCGTPAYIAPEILENKGYEGFPVDVWSSGIVLYAMLSGTVPFKANNLTDLHNIIIEGNFKEINDISFDCKDLLKKLLKVNPKERITIDEALKHKWLCDVFENDKLNLFTKAEKILLSKNNVDYRNCSKDEMIENFTIQNLDTKNVIESKNNVTKSIIFAPFNSSYLTKEMQFTHLENGISVENCALFFDEKVNILNRQYELNNNGEIDHGVLINQSNLTSRSTNNNENLMRMNAIIKRENFENPQNSEDEKSKNIIKKDNDIYLNKDMPNRNLGNIVAYLPTTSSTIVIDENVLKIMENFGYKKEYVQKCITNNDVNYCSSTYYLLTNFSDSVS